MTARVSIIIPTLNEAAILARSLHNLSHLLPAAAEICIVDGGSQDQTCEIAAAAVGNCPMQRLIAPTGRASQMNRGAAAATSEILCFVHADTQVPNDLVAVVAQTLSDPTIACGGFISLMVGAETTRWGVSLHNYLKTYYAPLLFRPHLFLKGLRLLFGDQVMFCRRQDFFDCGGFNAELPIMEEADLCLKLVRYGRIYQVNRVVQSSDRRVARWGAWKATGIYLMIGLLWGLGVPAQRLKRFYDQVR
jgi:rSAM/selenodomain-associated transferase 2